MQVPKLKHLNKDLKGRKTQTMMHNVFATKCRLSLKVSNKNSAVTTAVTTTNNLPKYANASI